jgi:hypothetical protein
MNRVERPAGVTLIALLTMGTGAVYAIALSPWDPFSELPLMRQIASVTTFDQTAVVTGFLAGGAILHFAAGLGMIAMKAWAWRLTILLTGVGLAIYLVLDLTSRPASLRLALYAAIAFYLNTRAVRDAFLRRREPDEGHP